MVVVVMDAVDHGLIVRVLVPMLDIPFVDRE